MTRRKKRRKKCERSNNKVAGVDTAMWGSTRRTMMRAVCVLFLILVIVVVFFEFVSGFLGIFSHTITQSRCLCWHFSISVSVEKKKNKRNAATSGIEQKRGKEKQQRGWEEASNKKNKNIANWKANQRETFLIHCSTYSQLNSMCCWTHHRYSWSSCIYILASWCGCVYNTHHRSSETRIPMVFGQNIRLPWAMRNHHCRSSRIFSVWWYDKSGEWWS